MAMLTLAATNPCQLQAKLPLSCQWFRGGILLCAGNLWAEEGNLCDSQQNEGYLSSEKWFARANVSKSVVVTKLPLKCRSSVLSLNDKNTCRIVTNNEPKLVFVLLVFWGQPERKSLYTIALILIITDIFMRNEQICYSLFQCSSVYHCVKIYSL